jgi:hypothetical protein
MFAVDFALHPGGRRATAVVPADAPGTALEKAFNLFP